MRTANSVILRTIAPSGPSSIALMAIPSATPTCGNNVMPRYFIILGSDFVILALIFESPIQTGEIAKCILPIFFLGIGSSGIAYTLQIIGQKGANPAAASILLSLESVFGVIGSAIFLGEVMTAREYIGCAVVFIAVILSQLNIDSLFKNSPTDKQTN